MARPVTTKKKAPTKSRAANKKVNYEIVAIALIALGLFIGFSFFFTDMSGAVGGAVKEISMGLFGLPAYLICFYIIGTCIHYFMTKHKENHILRYSLLFLMAVNASFLWQLLTVKESTNYWTDGILGVGGGVIGGIIAKPLNTLFGPVGSVIFAIALFIALFIIVFDISIVAVFKGIGGWFKDIFTSEEYDDEEYQEDTKKVSKKEKNKLKNTGKNENMSPEVEKELTQIKKRIFDFEKEFTNFQNDSNDSNNDSIKDSKTEKNKNKKDDDAPPFDMDDAPIQNTVQATQNPDENLISASIQVATEEALLPKKKKKEPLEQMEIEVANERLDYTYPSLQLLTEPKAQNPDDVVVLERTAKKLIDTLSSFNVDAKIVDYNRGPSITRYELQPSAGVKISKITNLADDLALNLAATGIRIEPIPGKTAIGIEVPNESQSMVYIRELIGNPTFVNAPSKLAFTLGKDIAGAPVVCDISRMPHLLIAGSTGSGKSVCINSLIVSILYKASPNEVKLVLVDPKVVELGVYNGIPHLLIPVVTDPKKAAGALQWAVNEMTNRYKLFADTGVRDLKGYNKMVAEKLEKGEEIEGEVPIKLEELPQIIIVIDELADLMMVAPNDVEDSICRLAQMARAAGMHLVIATQRPSVDVITGLIKANVPSRIAFAVSSYIDSRTILDGSGAEKLLGKGDMLYSPIGASKPIRLQGPFVADKEVEGVVAFLKGQNEVMYDQNVIEQIETAGELTGVPQNSGGDADELLPQAVEMALDAGQASVAMYQRRLKVGYQRAARLIDQMELRKIIGKFDGTKPREVLITKAQWNEMLMNIDAPLPESNEPVIPKPWEID